MVTTAKTIIISGYYGFRNSGDEAVLKSILTALEEESRQAGLTVKPVVLSSDPAWTQKMYGVEAVPRMSLGEVRRAIKNSDGLISGGGSLLQDATSPKSIPYYLAILKLAQWAGKPTFVYAQGMGPVQRKIFYPMIRSVFQRCEYVSVRDEQSAALLGTMKLKRPVVHVVPDPVMGLPLPSGSELHNAATETDEDKLPVVGVSVRYWDKEQRDLTAIADGLKRLAAERRVHLRFLPFHLPDDVQASRMVMDLLGDIRGTGSLVSMCEQVTDPQQMLLEVSRCSLMIGMRLHSLIYAASHQVPPLGISYDPKIDHFLSRVGSQPVGTTDALDGQKLANESIRLLDQRSQWIESQGAAIALLKSEARLPAQHIVNYLCRKG
ncbi:MULTISPECIES: polysaccharide pyruvyl transferase CsaB [Paenibacillus]|uniref:polysaccharide pyruvyl transferase CsaB n=1 Tax=Paenibacillus TaxID=44249 RepID=UPI0005CDEB5E|nr:MULTISPECIES: polysaccharide pyruvyl transferase CsaB [Paenibacillus]AUS28917.1 polysaccharide pyruvyl transferase [Paenibacillus polymyxa]KJD40315.1 polysaccharide pyruvyl transferase [Paenibacillus polymyxa]KJK29977.1 polysaccharide pyruvyl transferase [Paenibacillus polymyxa]MDG0054472.1 polysaccharide pyruvyl transferase CsaB [Paenibacillus sp. P2(2022)]MDU8673342.1 polysaccharide pyruvyl transferase CsaB [Paenibacillus polymyxa]